MKEDKPFINSAVILIAAVILFPVALVLLIIRAVGNSKKNNLRSEDLRLTGHTLIVTWVVIFGWNGIALVSSNDGTSTGSGTIIGIFIAYGIVFGIPALIFYLRAGRRKRQMEELYTAYYAYAYDQGLQSIEQIGQLVNQSTTNARQDLDYMIRSGRLPNARIDRDANQIYVEHWDDPVGRESYGQDTIVQGTIGQETVIRVNGQSVFGGNVSINIGNGGGASSAPPAPAPAPPAGPVMVNCSGCGASSQLLPGERKSCEFCGNGLQAGA